ncbi:MAG: hypothetical protein HZB67_05615 [Candidatus Aenigmarchaeota archaeon]|nr:hypothetical protein [Candidatus Aenigmarchaeota archaeon]
MRIYPFLSKRKGYSTQKKGNTMRNNNLILISLALVAVLLVSGCAQQPKKDAAPAKTEDPGLKATPGTAPTPLPTQVSASGDVMGVELAKSDALETDISDPDLDTLNSDLSEIEAGL